MFMDLGGGSLKFYISHPTKDGEFLFLILVLHIISKIFSITSFQKEKCIFQQLVLKVYSIRLAWACLETYLNFVLWKSIKP